MDTKHKEGKINTYEVYCKSFSRIIQCINAFSAVIEFQKDHPLEEIISIENVEYRATPPPPVRTAEEICDKWVFNTPMIKLKEAVIYAMEEYKSQFDRTQPEDALIEIDFELASLEDSLHGLEGKTITNIRGMVQSLINNKK